MRKFAVLGASALVLALGVAQASAMPTSQQWQEQVAARNAAAAPSANSDLRGFRAQVADQGAVQAQDQSRPPITAAAKSAVPLRRPFAAGAGDQVWTGILESEV